MFCLISFYSVNDLKISQSRLNDISTDAMPSIILSIIADCDIDFTLSIIANTDAVNFKVSQFKLISRNITDDIENSLNRSMAGFSLLSLSMMFSSESTNFNDAVEPHEEPEFVSRSSSDHRLIFAISAFKPILLCLYQKSPSFCQPIS